MNLKCLHCDHEFEGSMSWDDLGWHSSCPSCGCSFDVEVPEGHIVMAFADPDSDYEDPYGNFLEDLHDACILSYYAFSSRKEFLEKWEEKVYNEDPDGMWYWIVEDDHRITYGGADPGDIELICEAWGVETDGSADVAYLLEAAHASCIEGFCFCLTGYCPRKDCSRHKSRMRGNARPADLCTPNWKNCRNFQKG